jgi:outer membrane protein assembly factor BamB
MSRNGLLLIFIAIASILCAGAVQAAIEPRWSYVTDGNIVSPPSLGQDGTIYVGTAFAGGSLFALYPDGKMKWEKAIGWVTSSPTVAPNGTVYVGAGEGNLLAYSPGGTLKWIYEDIDGPIASSVAIGPDGTIYVGSNDTYLYSLDPGDERATLNWRYKTDGPVQSSPAIGADGTIYVGSEDGMLHAVDPDGEEIWTYSTGGPILSSPAIGADGTIYVGSEDDMLHAVDSDGEEIWTYATGGPILSSPAIGVDGTIYIGSDDGMLHAVDPDGKEIWTYATGGPISSSPAVGADGTVYVGSSDGKLYAVNSDGKIEWEYSTGDASPVDSSPAIAPDGTVYIGAYNFELYAFESASLGLADSPWPTMQHDNQRTGRVGGGSPAAPAEIFYPTQSETGNFSVSWSIVANAMEYLLERSQTVTFESPVTERVQNEISFEVKGLGAGTYYYRVRAENAWGVSPWTTGGAITVTDVICDLPAVPGPITYPPDSDSGEFVVSWPVVSDATAYTAERAESENFSAPTQVYRSGSETEFTESVGYSGIFYYRVRAENACGESEFSDHGGAIVVCIPPAAPASINHPSSSTTGVFTVSWPAATGASSYVLERSTAQDFLSSNEEVYRGSAASFSEDITPGTYFYRVKAMNPCGGESPWRVSLAGITVTTSSGGGSGSGGGGGGCTLGQNASPGLEWLLLILLGMGLCWRRIGKENC